MNEFEQVLNTKIYQNRLIHLITLSQDTFLDRILKKFRMEQAKKEVLACMTRTSIELISVHQQWLNERKGMCYIPYASFIGSII